METNALLHRSITVYKGEDFGFALEFENDITELQVFIVSHSDMKLLEEITPDEISGTNYYCVLSKESTLLAREDDYDLLMIWIANDKTSKEKVSKFITIKDIYHENNDNSEQD